MQYERKPIMRRTLLTALLLSLVVAWCMESSASQEAAKNAADSQAEAAKLAIIPLITLRPGETRELMLSTWCTVGPTRGTGFGLAEMLNGKRVGSEEAGKSYTRDGVTISVPPPDKATAFANSAMFSPLKNRHIEPFVVTILASADAKPGLIEMHLVDNTCAGQCQSHFRVLVLQK